MNTNLSVSASGDQLQRRVFLGCCGYEARSTEYFRRHGSSQMEEVWMFDYKSEGILSYDENRKFLTESAKIREENLFTEMKNLLTSLNDYLKQCNFSEVQFFLDISSMDRLLMAEILVLFFKARPEAFNLKLIYYPQMYVDPPHDRRDPVVAFGPVIPELSGLSSSSSEKLVLILGAGYERGKVVGSIDSLEPDETLIFCPTSPDERFEKEIKKANNNFAFLTDDMQVLDYELNDPNHLFNVLFGLIKTKHMNSRLVILPMGPKLFSAICTIVAIIFHPYVQVWRYSTVSKDSHCLVDAVAAGSEITMNLKVEDSSYRDS